MCRRSRFRIDVLRHDIFSAVILRMSEPRRLRYIIMKIIRGAIRQALKGGGRRVKGTRPRMKPMRDENQTDTFSDKYTVKIDTDL